MALSWVALCGALTSCAGDLERPPSLPALTAEPSVAPSPSMSPTPPEIAAPDAAGASAFGRYFYEQIEIGFATRDPDKVASLSAPECVICQRYVESITNLITDNERVDNYKITVLSSDAPAVEGSDARVTLIYNSSGGTRTSASGTTVNQESPRSNVAAELVLKRRADSWIVTEVRRG